MGGATRALALGLALGSLSSSTNVSVVCFCALVGWTSKNVACVVHCLESRHSLLNVSRQRWVLLGECKTPQVSVGGCCAGPALWTWGKILPRVCWL